MIISNTHDLSSKLPIIDVESSATTTTTTITTPIVTPRSTDIPPTPVQLVQNSPDNLPTTTIRAMSMLNEEQMKDSELSQRTGCTPRLSPAPSEEPDYTASILAVNGVEEGLAVALNDGVTVALYTGVDPASLAAIWDIPKDDSDEEVTPEICNLAATGSISVDYTEGTVNQQTATEYERLLHEAELADYLEYLRECDSTVQLD
ncbi:hypothetical protein MJO28_015301 [Puccinia striiformis f. sp. tritici]|uniref:Uncharacterized protein n=1 Tax=Puccinia striiformis f. sp. tritici TaxID=168172 RepID=A0ACC0DTD9_9BASI|nr:hypothetical protein MJO28_015301 [Puccinia striiformis f. sp. tritici]